MDIMRNHKNDMHLVKLRFDDDGIVEHVVESPGTLGSLGRVLGHILDDGPEIEARAPINVAEVRHEDVRLVAATESVIARKSSMPLALAVALLHDHIAFALTGHQVVREPIATHRTTLVCPDRVCRHVLATRFRTLWPMSPEAE